MAGKIKETVRHEDSIVLQLVHFNAPPEMQEPDIDRVNRLIDSMCHICSEHGFEIVNNHVVSSLGVNGALPEIHVVMIQLPGEVSAVDVMRTNYEH